MQLRFEQLAAQLNKNLAAIYLISGDEPLLVEESCDAIRDAAKKAGFSERQVFQVDSGFSWQALLTSADSLSLFSSKQLLELRCAASQLNETAAKVLTAYIANAPADKVLLIKTEKLDSKQQKSTWYTQLLQKDVVVQIWPLENAQLANWINQRLAAAGFTTTPEGVQLLCERSEGNLLAAKNEIAKLQLLYHTSKLTADNIADAVNDSARFDVFSLSDAILQGNAKRTIRILMCLKEEGIEPVLILWALTREIRTLANLSHQLTQGAAIEKLLQEYRVWEKRKPLYRQALQRHKPLAWRRLLQNAGQIDLIIKGQAIGNVWDELARISLAI